MPIRSTINDWGVVTKLFHWTIAFFVVVMIVFGVVMRWFLADNTPAKFFAFQMHKSFGFVLLCLVVLRMIWRFTAPIIPSPPTTLTPAQHTLSAATHYAFYALLVIQPLLGWAAASASPRNVPTVVFGVFTLPRLGGPSAERAELLGAFHGTVALLIVVLLLLHVAAAFRHHLVLKDDTLNRMLFTRRRSQVTAR